MATWNAFLLACGRLLADRRLWRAVLHPYTRYAAAWVFALALAGAYLYVGWTLFDNDTAAHRRDGNGGHCTIDFGGQYLMGRMLYLGHGRELYNRNVQRRVLTEVYPREDEDPKQNDSDVQSLMTWMMGSDDAQAAETTASFALPLAAGNPLGAAAALAAARQLWDPPPAYRAARAVAPLAAPDPLAAVALATRAGRVYETDRLERVVVRRVGGPLYPPVNAFVFFPLALLDPHTGYRADQVVNVALAFLAALGIRVLTRGRIWWPVAAMGVIVFPGCDGSINLGQNATLTFTILVWGWVLVSRGHPGWGGFVWGLLAFKPVWAAAFFLVPVLTRRWRLAATMLGTGVVLAVATLPVVGLQSWLDWLKVGAEATAIYKYDRNWIELSRDVQTLPRRWFDWDATTWTDRRDATRPALIGWVLWAAALEITVRLAVLRGARSRPAAGPGAAFVLLGAWLSCFHFMYYDILLGALPAFLLFTEPRRYLEPILVAIIPVRGGRKTEAVVDYYRPRLAWDLPDPLRLSTARGTVWTVNRVAPTVLTVMLLCEYPLQLVGVTQRDRIPFDTASLIVLWLWCGWLWVRGYGVPARPGKDESAPAPAATSEPATPVPAPAAYLIEPAAPPPSARPV